MEEGLKMAIVHVDKKNYKKEIEESDIPVIIDFWAGWCAPCMMMGPVFEQISNDYKGKLKFVKINVDENREFAIQFSIQGIPALIVAKKGKEFDRIVGFAPKDVLKSRIDDILSEI
jgi:thioredoxin 1